MEKEIQALGRKIFDQAKKNRPWIFHSFRWFVTQGMLNIAARDPYTKVKLLHFINILPSIEKNHRKIVQDLREYFPWDDSKILLRVRLPAAVLSFLTRLPCLGPVMTFLLARLVVYFVENVVARRFFIGETAREAVRAAERLRGAGRGVTVDVLGETVLSEQDTEVYLKEYQNLTDRLPAGDRNISVKISALYSEYNPFAWEPTKETIKKRLRTLLDMAQKKKTAVTLDMEHYRYKAMTIEVYKDLLAEYPGVPFSVAVQSYVRESQEDLEGILQWARDHQLRAGVRLVKGALWDYDVAAARRSGWAVPLFENKAETDLQFEKNARLLLENIRDVRPAFGTHNVRSMAAVLANAQALNVEPSRFEFQYLYGMIPEEIVRTLQSMGCRVRLYAPYGRLIPGLGYLVRRILENSSNESFLKRLRYDEKTIAQLLKNPGDLLKESSRQKIPQACMEKEEIPEGIGIRIKKVRRLAERLMVRAPRGHFSDDEILAAGLRIRGIAGDMESMAEKALSGVIKTPGEQNEYRYLPRGEGVAAFEDPEVSLAGLAGRIAAPLVTGNSFTVTLTDSEPHRRLARFFESALRSAGIGGNSVKFYIRPLQEIRSFNEGAAARPGIHWISFAGPSERAAVLRRIAFDFKTHHHESVKRFIEKQTCDDLLNYVLAKSIAENTMSGGFPPDLERKGGLVPGFINEPEPQPYDPDLRRRMRIQIENFGADYPPDREYPIVINGRSEKSGKIVASENPADPHHKIGGVYFADIPQTDHAVQAARKAFRDWSGRPVRERASMLREAAARMRKEKFRLAALITMEAGKPQMEALLEVNEAIDVLQSYAGDAERIGSEDILKKRIRKANGVAAVIAPWNFPLAILTGMAAGALVMGNTVVLKPAEQTSVTAFEFMRIMMEAGLPAGVMNDLPGEGELAGTHLVGHPDVDMIVFTGSREVGLQIIQGAEKANLRRPGKRPKAVVTEMGGKNPMIIDEDADLDQAVEAVVVSAFGYAGQKCSALSRVILLGGIREAFVQKLKAKVGSIVIGDPRNPGTMMGPLIDGRARKKVLDCQHRAESEKYPRLVFRNVNHLLQQNPGAYYAPLAVYQDVPADSNIAREEVFGPVLALMSAKDFEEALRIANASPYALTGGIFSRNPGNIERSKKELCVGNLYINRRVTGAVVGQHPFGGFKLSGSGEKAGGPDYLFQFTQG